MALLELELELLDELLLEEDELDEEEDDDVEELLLPEPEPPSPQATKAPMLPAEANHARARRRPSKRAKAGKSWARPWPSVSWSCMVKFILPTGEKPAGRATSYRFSRLSYVFAAQVCAGFTALLQPLA